MTATVSKALMAHILASLRQDGPGTYRELAERVGRHYVSVHLACRHLAEESRIRALSPEERGRDGRHHQAKVWTLAQAGAETAAQAADAPAGAGSPDCESQVFDQLLDGAASAASLASATGYGVTAVYRALRSMAARGEVEALDPTHAHYPAGRDRGRVWAVVRCRPTTLPQVGAITRGAAA